MLLVDHIDDLSCQMFHQFLNQIIVCRSGTITGDNVSPESNLTLVGKHSTSQVVGPPVSNISTPSL